MKRTLQAQQKSKAYAESWTYRDIPSWKKHFPTCRGHAQSPINIVSDNTKYDIDQPFHFRNYCTSSAMQTLSNTGYTLKVVPELHEVSAVFGGDLDTTYVLDHYHFHWGNDSTCGSEHTFDGKRYPLELHLVHFNVKYNSLDEAISEADGLAVLAVLFEISEEDDPSLSTLTTKIEEVRDPTGEQASAVAWEPLALIDLLPKDTSKFYRYQGSLTSPPCDESVTWTIFAEPKQVSEAQMEMFRNMKDLDGYLLVNNFRPCQRVNGRTVRRSF